MDVRPATDAADVAVRTDSVRTLCSALLDHHRAALLAARLGPDPARPAYQPSAADAAVDEARLATSAAGLRTTADALLLLCGDLRLDAALAIADADATGVE